MGIDVVNARATTADPLRERAARQGLADDRAGAARRERTQDATSNRITALYGRLYNLEQLNNATVTSGLAEMFGEANIEAFKQLALFARKGRLLDARRGATSTCRTSTAWRCRSCSCTARRTRASSRRARRARSSVWRRRTGGSSTNAM